MARIAQREGAKGSQKWLQRAVALDPGSLQPAGLGPLDWRSPVAGDAWAEYRDGAFLDLLGLGRLRPALADFWPRGGPQWDGLALAPGGTVVLVEAKAHVGEMLSSPCDAGAASLSRIRAALEATRAALGGVSRSDWTQTFYQYANRLAHLWWLRGQGVDARLLFVGFVGDSGTGGPDDPAVWRAMFMAANHALGLTESHPLARHVHHVHPRVG